MHRVHGEATECVMFMGRQWNASCSSGGLGRNRRWKRGLAYRKMEETDLLHLERGPVDREGCGVPQNGQNGLVLESYDRNGGPVDREGCGVPENGGNGLVLERYGQNGGPVHQEGCGVPQNGTPPDIVHLHRRPPPACTSYCLCTVDLLQPPPATFIHGLLFIQPPPRAPPPATVQLALSTGSCSTTPPRATVHPALHRLLFNQPSTGSSCSSSPPRGPVHPAPTGSIDRGPIHPEATASTTMGSCSSNPHQELFIQTPPTTLTVHPEAAWVGFS